MTEGLPAGRVSRPAGIPYQRIGDETLVVDPQGRKCHLLKGVGVRICELLATPIGWGEIVRALVEEFDEDAERAGRDLEKFLADLSERGLLARAEAEKGRA